MTDVQQQSEDRFIICVFWGQQCVPSVMKCCSKCGELIALDCRNDKTVEIEKLKPLCWTCGVPLAKAAKDDEFGALLAESLRKLSRKWSRSIDGAENRHTWLRFRSIGASWLILAML